MNLRLYSLVAAFLAGFVARSAAAEKPWVVFAGVLDRQGDDDVARRADQAFQDALQNDGAIELTTAQAAGLAPDAIHKVLEGGALNGGPFAGSDHLGLFLLRVRLTHEAGHPVEANTDLLRVENGAIHVVRAWIVEVSGAAPDRRSLDQLVADLNSQISLAQTGPETSEPKSLVLTHLPVAMAEAQKPLIVTGTVQPAADAHVIADYRVRGEAQWAQSEGIVEATGSFSVDLGTYPPGEIEYQLRARGPDLPEVYARDKNGEDAIFRVQLADGAPPPPKIERTIPGPPTSSEQPVSLLATGTPAASDGARKDLGQLAPRPRTIAISSFVVSAVAAALGVVFTVRTFNSGADGLHCITVQTCGAKSSAIVVNETAMFSLYGVSAVGLGFGGLAYGLRF